MCDVLLFVQKRREESKCVCICMCLDVRAFVCVGKIDLIKRLERRVAGQLRGKMRGRLFTLNNTE